MSRPTLLPAFALLFFAALVGTGCAGHGEPHTRGTPAFLLEGAGLPPLVDFLDSNHDGRIEPYEGAEAFLFLADEADADGDGVLTAAELDTYFATNRAADQAELEESFRDLDVNGSGELDRSELPGELASLLDVADANGSETLSLAELRASDVFEDPTFFFEQELLGFLSEADADGDGAFALSDLPLLDRLEFAEDFAQLDVNEDNLVDEAELMALLEDELRGATFDVRGTDAIMTGVIGPTTPGRVLELVVEHPEVERIVMLDVPGSMDDDSNVRAARLVRQAGLATHVPADGEVASGGTDFFQAGVVRTCGDGARFGIHSWAGFGVEGGDLPRDDPEHRMYVDYCREMGIPEDFYWYTLEVASADDIYWMTAEELERFGMLTEAAREPDEVPLLGGCVLTMPRGSVPADVGAVGGVEASRALAPFTKELVACGITLVAEQAVPDSFLVDVGAVIADMFRLDADVDITLRAGVLKRLHAYRALLPVVRSEASLDALVQTDPSGFERLRKGNSLCDIIMSEVPEGQVMEVVEHVLHTVTDVGLHTQFPTEWGLSRESQLWLAMQRAIARGDYVIDSYDELRAQADPGESDRVLLQEFASWFLTTAWDLQEPYGPDEEEWTLRTRAELKAVEPEFFEVFERTAGRVLRAPRPEVLARIGVTRAEEG
jgi:Ca2+-binding EF-hand superfamily protein